MQNAKLQCIGGGRGVEQDANIACCARSKLVLAVRKMTNMFPTSSLSQDLGDCLSKMLLFICSPRLEHSPEHGTCICFFFLGTKEESSVYS